MTSRSKPLVWTFRRVNRGIALVLPSTLVAGGVSHFDVSAAPDVAADACGQSTVFGL